MADNKKSARNKRPKHEKAEAITIYDIAKFTGVSKSTVSRVINGGRRVQPKTKELVERAIKKFNFSPNYSASSLSRGVDVRIGLIYSNPSIAYFTGLLMGALDASRRNAVHLLVERCDPADLEGTFRTVRNLCATGLSGIILPTPLSEQTDFIRDLIGFGVSIVGISGGLYAELNSVDIDNCRAANEMAKYLVGLGHRHIAFIQGPANLGSSKLRYRGVREAFAAAGNKVAAVVYLRGGNTFISGLKATERILASNPEVTAIFANNDEMASGVISALHQRGLRVPGDISVVGFDDSLSGNVSPGLTTIRQHISEIASQAVDLLMRDIRGKNLGKKSKPVNLLIDYKLVVRESAGPPRVNQILKS